MDNTFPGKFLFSKLIITGINNFVLIMSESWSVTPKSFLRFYSMHKDVFIYTKPLCLTKIVLNVLILKEIIHYFDF